MKVNYLFLSLFILLQSCQSIKIKENKEPSTRVQKLIGNIKEIRVSTISNPSPTNTSSKNEGITTIFYDRTGRIIKHDDKYNDKFTDYTIFEYDHSLVTKSTTISNSGSRELMITHKYDKKHNEIEYIAYWDKLLDLKRVMKYDTKGNVIEKQYFDASSKLHRLEKFDIDYKKQKVTVYEFDKEGKASNYYFTFEFDKHGNRTKSELINVAKKYHSCTIDEYDKKGNFLKSYSCNPDDNGKSFLVYNYIFDSVGNIIKQEEIINNVLSKTTIIDIIYW